MRRFIGVLIAGLALVVGLVVPPPKAVAAGNYPVLHFAREIAQMFDEHNALRAANGCGPLRFYPDIAEELTQPWTITQMENGELSHDHEFSWPGGSPWGENAILSSWSWWGTDTMVTHAMEGWMNSPGHKANILTCDYNSVALGVVIITDSDGWRQLWATANFYGGSLVDAGPSYASGAEWLATLPPFFDDITFEDSIFDDVAWLADQNITYGYADNTYRPQVPIDRGSMAAFLYRFAGRPSFPLPTTATFTDVPTDRTFFKEISWLADQGIARGYADGTFRPRSPVTRAHMAAFLYRAAGSPAYTPPSVSPFSDIPTSHALYREIAWLNSTGLSRGYSDGTYRPQRTVDRGNMAVFLHRFDTTLGPPVSD